MVWTVTALAKGRRARLAWGAAASLTAALAVPALADVKAGVDAWSAGNYQQAVAEWQEPAAQGDADALFNLAQAYRLGRGVTTDNVRARKLYEEAARRGHVKAADNFGLMLFQDGEQDKAMPLIRAAADRGDPRAQYVLGLSHFNADYAPRDWVRAYALMTLASSAGLPQAKDALGQMDQYVPQVQRSQAQSLAREIDAAAKGQRAADLAAADLGAGAPTQGPAVAVSTRASAATPVPVATPVAMPPLQTGRPASEISALPATVVRSAGRWRVQLGAFGVAANADRLWNQLASHAALAGTQKTLIPSGKLTRLLATGFTSEAEASRACTALKREGQACVVAGQG